jgi:adenosylmethionine-8-amino-7-oxononanoate aminotransferase
VNLFGHANPRIRAALAAQLAELEHVILAGFTHRPVVELSERLAALAPPGLGHAFYGSDGASAVEIALKMAFHYWKNRGRAKKTSYLSLAGSYHGETLGALKIAETANQHPARDGMLRRAEQHRDKRTGTKRRERHRPNRRENNGTHNKNLQGPRGRTT